MPRKSKSSVEKVNYIALREKTGLTQTQFWGMIGVTQSAGSRYESGRAPLKPIRTLIGYVFMGEPLERFKQPRRRATDAK